MYVYVNNSDRKWKDYGRYTEKTQGNSEMKGLLPGGIQF